MALFFLTRLISIEFVGQKYEQIEQSTQSFIRKGWIMSGSTLNLKT